MQHGRDILSPIIEEQDRSRGEEKEEREGGDKNSQIWNDLANITKGPGTSM